MVIMSIKQTVTTCRAMIQHCLLRGTRLVQCDVFRERVKGAERGAGEPNGDILLSLPPLARILV